MNLDDRPHVRTRARMLALCHTPDHAIAAKLADELSLPFDDVSAWVDANAVQLERWRHVAEADLCERIDAVKRGDGDAVNGTQLALMTELARQHLGWSRDSVPEQVAKGYKQAKRDAGKNGTKRGPTGVAA